MHGQLRSEYKAKQRDPKIAATLARKAEQWYTLTAQINDENALALTDKLLTVNPDPLYLWNERRRGRKLLEWETESQLTATALRNNPKAYGAWFHRKWCLVHLVVRLKESSTATSPPPATATPCIIGPVAVLKQELRLTVQFLERDERNFHCWNYRRFVVSMLLLQQNMARSPGGIHDPSPGVWNILLHDENDDAQGKEPYLLMGAQIASAANEKTSIISQSDSMVYDETTVASNDSATPTIPNIEVKEVDSTDWIAHEWEFTQEKIGQNFSNFSAFHYRSKLYHVVLQRRKNEGDDKAMSDQLKKELRLIENAIFTEPDDQTAWWYQSFLLRQEEDGGNADTCTTTSSSSFNNDEVWNSHVENLRELAEEMTHSKWVVLGLINCGIMMMMKRKRQKPSTSDSSSSSEVIDSRCKKEELRRLCEKVLVLDPDRKGRYISLMRRIDRLT